MNCPECTSELMTGSYACKCGWKGIPPRILPPREAWKPYNAQDPEIVAARERCMASMKQFMNKSPSRDWAYRIIERHKAGEILSTIQIEKAYKAVGKPVENMGES